MIIIRQIVTDKVRSLDPIVLKCSRGEAKRRARREGAGADHGGTAT